MTYLSTKPGGVLPAVSWTRQDASVTPTQRTPNRRAVQRAVDGFADRPLRAALATAATPALEGLSRPHGRNVRSTAPADGPRHHGHFDPRYVAMSARALEPFCGRMKAQDYRETHQKIIAVQRQLAAQGITASTRQIFHYLKEHGQLPSAARGLNADALPDNDAPAGDGMRQGSGSDVENNAGGWQGQMGAARGDVQRFEQANPGFYTSLETADPIDDPTTDEVDVSEAKPVSAKEDATRNDPTEGRETVLPPEALRRKNAEVVRTDASRDEADKRLENRILADNIVEKRGTEAIGASIDRLS